MCSNMRTALSTAFQLFQVPGMPAPKDVFVKWRWPLKLCKAPHCHGNRLVMTAMIAGSMLSSWHGRQAGVWDLPTRCRPLRRPWLDRKLGMLPLKSPRSRAAAGVRVEATASRTRSGRQKRPRPSERRLQCLGVLEGDSSISCRYDFERCSSSVLRTWQRNKGLSGRRWHERWPDLQDKGEGPRV